MDMLATCRYCGKTIDPKNGRKYCSAACKEGFRVYGNKVDAVCLYCGKTFKVSPIRPARFCSTSCGTRYGNEHSDLTKTCICIDCGVSFKFTGRTKKKRCDKCKAKFRSNSTMIRRAAKDNAVAIGVGSGGLQTPNQHTKQLSAADSDAKAERLAKRREAYKVSRERQAKSATGNVNYRKLVMTGNDSCSICGYNVFQEGLVVHHIDCDRANNCVDNLTILCASCHNVLHKRMKRLIRESVNLTEKELCLKVISDMRDDIEKS